MSRGPISKHSQDQRPSLLVAGADERAVAWLRSCVDDRWRVAAVTDGAALEAALGAAPGVIVLGAALADMTAAQALDAIRARRAARESPEPAILLLADPATEADVVGSSAVFYRIDRRMRAEHVRGIIASAYRAFDTNGGHGASIGLDNAADAAHLQRILDAAQQFAMQTTPRGASESAVSSIMGLIDLDRAYCLFHDPDTGALWAETDDELDDDSEFHASHGLAGFAARTRTPAFAERAARDPRYSREVDDPRGTGDESVIACPIVGTRKRLDSASDAPGQEQVVHAVVIGVRRGRPFLAIEERALAVLCDALGPLSEQLALRVEAESVIAAERARRGADDLFRAEAYEAYVSRGRHGDVVRVSPAWVRWAYWPLLALLVCGVAYLIIGTVEQYSTGPAIVVRAGHTEVTADVAGTVATVEVTAQQRVRGGQVIARLYNASEAAEFARIQTEFESALRNHMLDPADVAADAAVRALRNDLQRAQARLDERAIRAPHDGSVTDLRIRPGQHLSPGDLVVSLVNQDTELSVVALLPGRDRPQLRPGLPLRVELAGYRYAYQDLIIESVDDEIIGPAAARRHLSSRVADSVFIPGPVVMVKARLTSDVFEADGKTYRYHDGLQARAEARVRSRRIIFMLIPQLEQL